MPPLWVEDRLREEEFSARFNLLMGETGGRFQVPAQVNDATDAEARCAVQRSSTSVNTVVHVLNGTHKLGGGNYPAILRLTEGVAAQDEQVFEAKCGDAQQVALKCQGIHVSHSQAEYYFAACMLADEVGRDCGVGAGYATGVVVDGDEISVQAAGVVKEIQGRPTRRGKIADDEGTSLV